MTEKSIKEEKVTKNSIEEEEGLDLDELQSVFTDDEDESIDSSDEEESPFQLLLKKGKNEGFITYAELNENLPEGVIEADRLEEIVEMISDMGISVQEHANKASDGESATNDQETINPIENEIGKTTDPVRMYMREMGTIELLDREGEIVIAKKMPEKLNPIGVACIGNFLAVFFLWPILYGSGQQMTLNWPLDISGLAIFGISFISAVAYTLYIFVIKLSGPLFASQSSYVVTLAGVFWGMAIFEEEHSLWVWSSLVSMLVGLILVTPRKNNSGYSTKTEFCIDDGNPP